MSTRLLVGDVRQRIAEIPDGTVDLVVTSPPFLALRKYGDNDAEMGSEGTPADFLDALLELTQEFRRVLAPHGSIAIELGDTYSGAGGAGGDYGEDGLRAGQAKFRQVASREHRPEREGTTADGGPRVVPVNTGAGWPLAKSLALIPQLYPASLAYGRNLLRPEHTFTPWRVRNIITWCRPNPPVGALGDKVRVGTSYITVACTSARRWFDLDAVRTEHRPRWFESDKPAQVTGARRDDGQPFVNFGNPAGAPPLDWWDDALDPDDPTDHLTIVMPTQPYPGAHYATWPAKLAQRLIDMMCPARVCRECGKPSKRIVGEAEYVPDKTHRNGGRMFDARRVDAGVNQWGGTGQNTSVVRNAPTLGWSDCECDDSCAGLSKWRPGHVLDPFAGSGTTLAVAMGMGRDVTGIELYPENAWLVRERVGMFLELDGDVEPPKETPLDVLRDHFADQDDL